MRASARSPNMSCSEFSNQQPLTAGNLVVFTTCPNRSKSECILKPSLNATNSRPCERILHIDHGIYIRVYSHNTTQISWKIGKAWLSSYALIRWPSV